MNDLVLNKNTVGVITLKEITDLINVRHDRAMQKVNELSAEPSFGTVSKIDIVYNDKGQKILTYLLNKKQAIAISAKLNNSLLMKVIDRLEELESQKIAPVLTVNEKISLIAQGHQEVEQRLSIIEHKIENDITLTSAQKYHLKELVTRKVFEIKNNHNLDDSFTKKNYQRIWKKLKKHFIVSSYMEIPKSKFDEACNIVQNVSLGDLI